VGVTYAGFRDARLEAGVDRVMRRVEYVSGMAQARGAKSGGAVVVEVAEAGGAVQSLEEDESYSLAVSATQVKLSARTVVGALHGMETLLQLLDYRQGECRVDAVRIEDAPRFRWRGLMIDVSRHFEPV